MDPFTFSAWLVSLLAGGGGLILGIRSEVRHRYRKHWAPEWQSTSQLIFHNRTGEDASNVRLEIATERWKHANYRPYSLVPVDGAAKFAIVPDDRRDLPPFKGALKWIRTSSGREYTLRIQ